MSENVTQPPVVEGYQSLRIEDTNSYIDVRSINTYEFIDHTYDGTSGYRTGYFLIPHPREVFYQTRAKSSYYVNPFKPVINAMVNPVFKEQAVRETSSEQFQGFIENCDNAGTPFQSLIKTAMIRSRRAGICFVIVDNVKDANKYETVKDATDARAYPYAYVKAAQDMEKIDIDKYGNPYSITFKDGIYRDGQTCYQKYRYFDTMTWKSYYEKGTGEDKKTIVLEEGAHNLGALPVVVVNPFVEQQSVFKMPDPPYYDLAFLSYALFNKESLVTTLEQNQSFSIFYVSDIDRKSLGIGPTSFLSVGENSKFPPGYASPDAQHIRNLVDNCNRLEERIRSLAQQNGVIGVVKQSGIAKEWDFRAEEAVLQETALAATNLEYAIHDLFDLYIGKASEYVVKYPKRYSPTYATERIAQARDILDAMPPDPIRAELWGEIAETMWATDEERLERAKAGSELERESKEQTETEDINAVSST